MAAKSRGRRLIRVMLAAAAAGVLILTLVYAVTRPVAPRRAAAIEASLELAAGEVSVDTGAGDVRAISGASLMAGSRISTGKGARALVRLPDGASVFLRDGTQVKLEADRVELERGEYWLDAPPVERSALSHRAGDVMLSAADAGLSLKRQGSDVVVYVSRGMAIVSGTGGRVEVHAGEHAAVRGPAAPTVSPVVFWDDWTGGMADFASGRGVPGAGAGVIYGVDDGAPAASAAGRLLVSKQVVRARVRDGLSETEVDQTFSNPGERPVEGWYWFTVPERASVTGFAVETAGELVWGEFIEQREAAAKYGAAKQTGHHPAILEWVNGRTYRARIYPVEAGKARRVVTRYIELRPIVDGKLEYVYPMASRDPVRIGEFSLSVDLGEAGKSMRIATLADARVEDGGTRITMRRSGYTPRADFRVLAASSERRRPFTVARFDPPGEDSADYVMARYTPDVDWTAVAPQRGDVVVAVDTSAAGAESTRQLKSATAEAILRSLSDEDRFALVSLDARPTVLHPSAGLAAASEQEIARALERLAEHATGGATDLASMFDVSLGRLHGAEQPAVVYVGDGIATSGEMTGEQLVERLRRALSTSRARVFTVGVGSDADHALLGELARAGGGQSFRVDESEQTTARALELTAALKVPTITGLEIDLGAGLDEPFTTAAGKISRGSEVIVLARTHHPLPARASVRGYVGGQPFEKSYDVTLDRTILSSFVPRFWAAEYARRLLGSSQGPGAERARIVSLGIDYGLMTPFTSILALESEFAYREMGIERRSWPLRGERLGALTPDREWRLAARHAYMPGAGHAFGCAREEPAAGTLPLPAASAPLAERSEEALALEAAPQPGTAPEYPDPAEQPPPAAPRRAMPARPEVRAADQLDPGIPSDSELRRGVAAATAKSGLMRSKSQVSPDYRGGNRFTREGAAAQAPAEPPAPVRESIVQPRTCSDAAARPLAERVLIWRKRMKSARTPEELVERYEMAVRACELTDWRAERTFLELLPKRLDSAHAVNVVLNRFAGRPEVQKYLAKLILRRTVDPTLIAAVERVLFGAAVDWQRVDLELAEIVEPSARVARLREIMARAPADPNGDIRLVRLLIETGDKDEALALGRRLRDQGFVTPLIAQQLGDVIARAGFADEAVRSYSEIVEFDPDSRTSRRLLGDVYLGHAWYEPAYRQYRTLTEAAPEDALGWLRLAAAAAGSGRVDEALRLERKVANAQGNPGPDDPRRWARLMSASRLARLIDSPPKDGADPGRRMANIKRELKELQLFSGPGTLVLLTWEDLLCDVALVTRAGDNDVALGERTDAAQVGLSGVVLATSEAERSGFVARLRGAQRDAPLALMRHDITYDGRDFRVRILKTTLAARSAEARL